MRAWIVVPCLLAITVVTVTPTRASSFTVSNLASDQPGVAPVTDPQLVNAWGIASSAASPFWIGSNGSGVSEVYNGAGVKSATFATIPGDGSVTGVAFNTGGAGQFNSDLFLFASEDGTVSGWRGALGSNAEVLQLADPSNVYKGLTVGTVAGHSYSYVANFRTGGIDVVKGDTLAPSLTGHFVDPNLPAGYAPFNVQNIGGILYVTYAVQDATKKDDVAGVGNGIVDTFDLNGNFMGRLVSGGALNSPWGLALAPAGFGSVAGDLLVGNFGDGLINAYNPITGAALGTLLDPSAAPLVIDGLWGLRFGNGGNGGSPDRLYFTAGPDGESHGLFGNIAAGPDSVPEPGTWMLVGSALAGLVAFRRRRSTHTEH